MRLPRVLKGIATSAALWGVAWVPLTIALAGISALFGAPLPPRAFWGFMLLRQAVGGALNGAVFGIALAVFARRRTLGTLSYRRAVACGAVGGAVFPLVMTGLFLGLERMSVPLLSLGFGIGISSAVGGICAASSLYLARRAPARTPAISPTSAELPAITA